MIEMIIHHFAHISKDKHLKKLLEQSNMIQYFMKNFDTIDLSARCLLKLRKHYSEYEYVKKINQQNVPQKNYGCSLLFLVFCRIFC